MNGNLQMSDKIIQASKQASKQASITLKANVRAEARTEQACGQPMHFCAGWPQACSL